MLWLLAMDGRASGSDVSMSCTVMLWGYVLAFWPSTFYTQYFLESGKQAKRKKLRKVFFLSAFKNKNCQESGLVAYGQDQ